MESGHGSALLLNANGPAVAVGAVEMVASINEHRDIHSIFDLPHDLSPSTSSVAAVGTAREIDFQQPSPLPPPPTEPAVVNAVVPSSPQRQRMELNRLLSSSDKSEWIENGAHAAGGLGQTGDNSYNDDEMNDGVNITGPEGQRNNDIGHVWYGDTAVAQPNLDQDKKDPSMAFSHLEQPTPLVLSTITRTPGAKTGSFQSQSSRTLPPFSTQGQQQRRHSLEPVPQEYYQSTPPFSSNSNSYYSDINNRGQPRTATFLPWDTKQELNEPSPSSAPPLFVFHQQQQEEDLYLEPPYPHQDLLNQHRPSDCSEVLMLQQQEFLRLTRLRSQASSVVSANDPALGAFSEKTEVLQDHPMSDKTEIDFNNNRGNFINDSSYHFQQQQFQQQRYQDFIPPHRYSQEYYDDYNISQHPDNNEMMLRVKLQEKMTLPPGEEVASKRLSMYIPPDSLPPEFDEIPKSRESAKTNRAGHAIANANAANANVNRTSNNIPNASAGSSGRNSRSSSSRGNPNVKVNANVNNAITDGFSHPSYSSTHLQNYVNTTMPHPYQHPQSGRSSVQSFNLTSTNVNPTHLTNPTNSVAGVYNFNAGPASGSRSGAGRSPYGHGNTHGGNSGNNNWTTTTVGSGGAPSPSSGGITGEDAQGRWVGSPTGADNRVSTYGTSDIHKSKCCIIQ